MSRYTLCAHLRLNRHEEAGQAISKALELYPDRPSLYEILGNIHVSRYTAFAYTETGDADLRAAVAVFRKAIAIDGRRSRAHYNLGVVDGYLDSPRLAEKSFAGALEADSTLAAANKELGILRRASGRLRSAAALEFRRTIEIDPGRVDAVMGLGRLYLETGSPDSALPYFERAVPSTRPIRSPTCGRDGPTGSWEGWVRRGRLSARPPGWPRTWPRRT